MIEYRIVTDNLLMKLSFIVSQKALSAITGLCILYLASDILSALASTDITPGDIRFLHNL